MKLIQFFLPGKGKRVGLIRGDQVLDITASEEGVSSTLDLVAQGKTAAGFATRATWLAKRLHRKPLDYGALQRAPSRRAAHLVMPIEPPEVWGAVGAAAAGALPGTAGVSPATRPAGPVSLPEDPRPAFFFKGTAERSVGPGEPIAIRHDSSLTLPEPGIAAVLGPDGGVVAFTSCDDVTARDLALAQPGFLSQAKVYGGSFALGPCLVTPDELGDPDPLQVRCTILRGGETMFSEAVGTAGLPRRLAELAVWLVRDNPRVPGAVVFVGAGVEIPEARALRNGDRVEIEAQGIGRLSNPVGR
ncbi:MAG TPA: fumarylacetoacetate hydrolase family protein [Candidatus Methylomirabilis sp.]